MTPQPVPAFNFRVLMFDVQGPLSGTAATLGAIAIATAKALMFGFSEVTGLAPELEIEEYPVGGWNQGSLKFARRGRHSNLTFKRGVTINTDVWDWYYQVAAGSGALIRKSGVIILYDRGSPAAAVIDKLPIAAWYFSNALPVRLHGPELNAKANELAIETLEIAPEFLTRIGPAMIPGNLGSTLAGLGV
jgi:phage tail-like protein